MNKKIILTTFILMTSLPGIVMADTDGDTYDSPTDCDDNNDQINPDAIETCNDVDDDCDGIVDNPGAVQYELYYQDSDGDTYGDPDVSVSDCAQPVGYVSDNTDCDDTDATISPVGTEVCDGEDNNCDSTVDETFADTDVDGTADCVDTEECDALDNDGDGETDEGVTSTFYADADGDLFGDATSTVTGCSAPLGYVTDDTDCDDTSALRFPGNDEDCDGIDNDCDGTTADEEGDEDADGTLNCDDTEECDGEDNDGDGDVDEGVTTTFYEDADGDTFGNADESTAACTQPDGYVTNDTDCDDTAESISPDGTETCGDGVDQDCDGDDLACEPAEDEDCDDAIDNDEDTLIDCDDDDCAADTACAVAATAETCDDEVDNDEDALIDCDDDDCTTDTTCAAISADSESSSASGGCALNKSSRRPLGIASFTLGFLSLIYLARLKLKS